jgi:hypothetical protein
MNIAEAAVSTAVAPPVPTANLQAAQQQPQPKPINSEFGGFHLTYDPQNRELFLVLTNSGTGQVQDQIPGFQTISSRRNSTPAAPANLVKASAHSSSHAAPAPQGGAPTPSGGPAGGGAPSAGAAASTARGATVNIAS